MGCFPFRRRQKPKYRLLAYNRRAPYRWLQLPKPLGHRTRALTIPLPEASRSQQTIVQSKSTLLTKLPGEIRTPIWDYCLADMTFSLYFENGCLIRSDRGPEPLPAPPLRQGLLSLFLACRQT